MPELLSILVSILFLVGFVIYNQQAVRGTSTPNTATWTVWVFMTVLNLASYSSMTNDWTKYLPSLVSSTACIFTYIIVLYKGKFARISGDDTKVLIIDIIACAVWWYTNSATYGNLIMQVAVVISFIPTYRGVWQNPKNEKALPWWIFTAGYAILATMIIVLRWRGQIEDLVYPVNCLVLHGAVAILSKRRPT